MKTKLGLGVLLAACVVALSVPAFAGGNFYGGVSVGLSEADGLCSDLFPLGADSCDDEDTAWKILGGYHITERIGVELFYADFGKFDGSGSFEEFSATGSVEADGFGLSGVYTYPVNERFGIFGKAGVFRWEAEWSASKSDSFGSVSDSGNDGRLDLTFGAGAEYALTEDFSLRAEWEWFKDVGAVEVELFDIELDGADVNFLSLGILFSP
jgi:OOP family OmpA-OmpF porin